MFQRILLVALLAGLFAGVATAIVQMSWSVPLILQAETYETAAPAPAAAHTPEGHAHGAADWAPADGFERNVFTVMTNVLLGVGGALLIAAAFALRRTDADWKTGLAWGAGAYVAFALSPAIGLPPELPGTAAAELGARQGWWAFTVIATGAGLIAAAYCRSVLPRLAGVALVLVPHVVGAPQPAHHEALAPVALQNEFILAALVSSAVFWIALGGAVGFLAGRFGLSATPVARPNPA